MCGILSLKLDEKYFDNFIFKYLISNRDGFIFNRS